MFGALCSVALCSVALCSLFFVAAFLSFIHSLLCRHAVIVPWFQGITGHEVDQVLSRCSREMGLTPCGAADSVPGSRCVSKVNNHERFVQSSLCPAREKTQYGRHSMQGDRTTTTTESFVLIHGKSLNDRCKIQVQKSREAEKR